MDNTNRFYDYQRYWMYAIVDFMRSKKGLNFTQDDIPDRLDLYQIYTSETFKADLKIDSYTNFLQSSLFAFMQTFSYYLSTLAPDKFLSYCKDVLLNGGLPYGKD